MRNVRILCLFLSLGLCIAYLPSASAENKRKSDHIPTGKILEFSLVNLKKSFLKTMQQNERLAFENTALEQDIQHLRQILETLMVKRSELSGEPLPFEGQKASAPLIQSTDLKKRRNKAQNLISVFERDVEALEEESRVLEGKLDQKMYKSEKQLLLERRQSSQRSLSKAQKRLHDLEKKRGPPLRQIEALKREKHSLEYQIEMLERVPVDSLGE